MINSRKLEDLHPRVRVKAEALKAECAKEGINIIFTSTLRDNECQQDLYNKGRTASSIAKKERKVTNAKPGQSYHNWGVAFDVVPIVGGKAIWNDTKVWDRIGAIGVSLGLEWAGNWKRFKEMPHFQFTNGLTLKDFQSGRTLSS